MAPAYKLIYFDSRGVAEFSRFLLKYGNIEFEDVRIKKENWPSMKDSTPFGQLPVLEHNGKRVGQSLSIARYLGKLVKLAGNDDWENLEIDAVVDTFSDLRTKIRSAHHEQDEVKKVKLMENVINETIPYYFSRFETMIEKNKGYLALGRLTWADMVFASIGSNVNDITGCDTLAKYPKIKALIEKVNALPAIKKWIEIRPKSDF